MRSEFLAPPNAFSRFLAADDGTVTVEYAMAFVVGAVVAGVLYGVVNGWVPEWLDSLIRDALDR